MLCLFDAWAYRTLWDGIYKNDELFKEFAALLSYDPKILQPIFEPLFKPIPQRVHIKARNFAKVVPASSRDIFHRDDSIFEYYAISIQMQREITRKMRIKEDSNYDSFYKEMIHRAIELNEITNGCRLLRLRVRALLRLDGLPAGLEPRLKLLMKTLQPEYEQVNREMGAVDVDHLIYEDQDIWWLAVTRTANEMPKSDDLQVTPR